MRTKIENQTTKRTIMYNYQEREREKKINDHQRKFDHMRHTKWKRRRLRI
jgi:hypothetical protein